MPLRYTTKNGKPAVAWGKSGARYVYTRGNKASLARAKAKANRQRTAILANQRQRGRGD